MKGAFLLILFSSSCTEAPRFRESELLVYVYCLGTGSTKAGALVMIEQTSPNIEVALSLPSGNFRLIKTV